MNRVDNLPDIVDLRPLSVSWCVAFAAHICLHLFCFMDKVLFHIRTKFGVPRCQITENHEKAEIDVPYRTDKKKYGTTPNSLFYSNSLATSTLLKCFCTLILVASVYFSSQGDKKSRHKLIFGKTPNNRPSLPLDIVLQGNV